MTKHDEAILLLAILLKSEIDKAIGNAVISVLQEYAGEISVEEILETVQRTVIKARTRSEYAKLILEAGRHE
jgi:hypothetical protein